MQSLFEVMSAARKFGLPRLQVSWPKQSGETGSAHSEGQASERSVTLACGGGRGSGYWFIPLLCFPALALTLALNLTP